MRLGLIVRTDAGGLAAQSKDFHDWLRPSSTLVVSLGPDARGSNFVYAWNGQTSTRVRPRRPIVNKKDINNFLSNVDVVLTLETFYGREIQLEAQRRGIRTVRYVNPELFRPEQPTDKLVIPTYWRQDLVRGATVIPPGIRAPEGKAVARETFKKHPVVLCLSAPAMKDRNGVLATIDAFKLVDKPCHLIFRNVDARTEALIATADWKHTSVIDNKIYKDRWAQYRDNADFVVLPRRYGGNCLPMFEAAACGLPIVSTELSPQSSWIARDLLCKLDSAQWVAMVGGHVEVFSPSIESLANRISWLLEDDHRLKQASLENLALAKSHDWQWVAGLWQDLLSGPLR